MSRTGLSDIRLRLRPMIEAGTADYTVNSVSYWTDDQLDTVLDRHRTDLIYDELIPVPVYEAGSELAYYEYRARWGNLEQTTGGTAVFYVQDGTGAVQGTALYSSDYARGIVTFISDTEGATYYLTARSYDVFAAAADIWEQKAAHYVTAYNFSTDGHNLQREVLLNHCIKMANYYSARSDGGLKSTDADRGDTA